MEPHHLDPTLAKAAQNASGELLVQPLLDDFRGAQEMVLSDVLWHQKNRQH